MNSLALDKLVYHYAVSYDVRGEGKHKETPDSHRAAVSSCFEIVFIQAYNLYYNQ